VPAEVHGYPGELLGKCALSWLRLVSGHALIAAENFAAIPLYADVGERFGRGPAEAGPYDQSLIKRFSQRHVYLVRRDPQRR
jgi:hypothetical protein